MRNLSNNSTNLEHFTLKGRALEGIWRTLSVNPRAWQREALPIALEAIEAQWRGEESYPIVQAVMGAGKSLLVAAILQACLRNVSTIVVTTPRAMLVRQLTHTLSELLPLGAVGMYYGTTKQPGRQVIVACDASTARLSQSLERAGRQVDLWVADECHGSEADRMKEWCEKMQPRARLGLTATPRRASRKEALSLWSVEIYRYHAGDALRDGVVVPFILQPWTGTSEITLDDAILSMILDAVRSGVGPGVVDASSIEDAKEFAQKLCQNELVALPIHSKLPAQEVRRRLKLLEMGDINVIVHISMLKEGIDLPWLRWIGLRRQVSSPVYFAQHVGRVLRSSPGKDHALILDPGDLFSRHSLTLDAILEADVEPELEDSADLESDFGLDLEKGSDPSLSQPQEPEVIWAQSLTQAQVWLRSTVTILRLHNFVRPSAPGHHWRSQAVTPAQLNAIENWAEAKLLRAAVNRLGDKDASALRMLYVERRSLNKGDASDLISILACFAQRPDIAQIFSEPGQSQHGGQHDNQHRSTL